MSASTGASAGMARAWGRERKDHASTGGANTGTDVPAADRVAQPSFPAASPPFPADARQQSICHHSMTDSRHISA